MADCREKSQRKILFINKRFQSYFIIRFSLGVMVSALLFGVILFYSSMSDRTIIFNDLRLKLIPTHEYIFPSLVSGLIISIFLTCLLCIVLGLMYSHRIAGPMYRFEMIFKNLAKGDLKQDVKLRSYDEWQDTAGVLDEAITSIRSGIGEISSSFQELKTHVGASDPETAAKVSRVEKAIGRFIF